VVDDEPGIRRPFASALESGGYEVITAGDGAEAVRTLQEHDCPVIITDLVMPNQEGIESIQTIRKDFPKVRIIAISASSGGSYPHTAKMLGAHAVLAKPVSPEDLLATVRQVLSGAASG
jgi:CheY-like chemotaxis protein